MTASAARDHIPSDIGDLSNCMCIFILTGGNGTPFDASYILEEEVIEICIWLGHTYPEGVLQYATIESVMPFHTMNELQIAVHGIMKALTLHDEAIKS